MTKPINEEGKEFELEETTYSRRLLAEPRHIQLQSLLDANDELVIGTVWQFLKELITTNNGSFNPETLDTISNEVEKINLKIVQSKHTSNYKTLLDANDELVIGTVWQFLKELITTNNGSFNPETLDTISNEV
eukprot:248620_1